jgi:hypothetical protein
MKREQMSQVVDIDRGRAPNPARQRGSGASLPVDVKMIPVA